MKEQKPHWNIFFDQEELKAGHSWQKRLYDSIGQLNNQYGFYRDYFDFWYSLLFCSLLAQYASQSKSNTKSMTTLKVTIISGKPPFFNKKILHNPHARFYSSLTIIIVIIVIFFNLLCFNQATFWKKRKGKDIIYSRLSMLQVRLWIYILLLMETSSIAYC